MPIPYSLLDQKRGLIQLPILEAYREWRVPLIVHDIIVDVLIKQVQNGVEKVLLASVM